MGSREKMARAACQADGFAPDLYFYDANNPMWTKYLPHIDAALQVLMECDISEHLSAVMKDKPQAYTEIFDAIIQSIQEERGD